MNKIKIRFALATSTLMQQKPLDKITVNDICSEALLARATFYHHFKDKFDLINWAFDTIFDATVMQIGESRSWEKNIEAFLHGLKENASFFSNAYKYVGQNSIEDHHYDKVFELYRKIYEKNKGSALTLEDLYCLEVYCRGAVFITAQWVREGMQQPGEWMTHMFRRSMTPEIQEHICK